MQELIISLLLFASPLGRVRGAVEDVAENLVGVGAQGFCLSG